MYTTIEADIENGVVRSVHSAWLPAHAHVLITLLSGSPNETTESLDKSKVVSGLMRTPNPVICGKMKLLGDIMGTAPATSWDLPA